MAAARQLHLGAFMRPASIYTGAWALSRRLTDMTPNFAHIKQSIQALERAKFDAFFMADHMAVLNMPMDALKRSHTSTSFELVHAVVGALTSDRRRIGLAATGSTTFDAPLSHRAALRLARLDLRRPRRLEHRHHVQSRDAALNFGLRRAYGAWRSAIAARGEVLRRGDWTLWDRLGGRCSTGDVEDGVFFDSAKNARALTTRGNIFSVRGPVNIARSIQGLVGDRAGWRF